MAEEVDQDTIPVRELVVRHRNTQQLARVRTTSPLAEEVPVDCAPRRRPSTQRVAIFRARRPGRRVVREHSSIMEGGRHHIVRTTRSVQPPEEGHPTVRHRPARVVELTVATEEGTTAADTTTNTRTTADTAEVTPRATDTKALIVPEQTIRAIRAGGRQERGEVEWHRQGDLR